MEIKAFISYSHNDSLMLDILHKHLAQLQREGIISTWTDRMIAAGGKFDNDISQALSASDLFLALISPDYIASEYCVNKEFEKALKMQEKGQMIIIPIIVEPSDWLSTPFKEFKALPKDGKPISTWENKNTAFLDVIQSIRHLIVSGDINKTTTSTTTSAIPASRNYRVQKDFDTIEKMELLESTFHKIKEYLKRYIDEIILVDNIKARILNQNDKDFECLLVNRNKIATESQLKLTINSEKSGYSSYSQELQITYSITSNSRPSSKNFTMAFDDYHLFWSENNMHIYPRDKKEVGAKDIADIIWNEWLQSVGIL